MVNRLEPYLSPCFTQGYSTASLMQCLMRFFGFICIGRLRNFLYIVIFSHVYDILACLIVEPSNECKKKAEGGKLASRGDFDVDDDCFQVVERLLFSLKRIKETKVEVIMSVVSERACLGVVFVNEICAL